MKKLISFLAALCLVLACTAAASANAAQPTVYETQDGVLSIQAPDAGWVVLQDPNYWFVMTDGDDFITISHLSNGEALPAVNVADEEFAAIYHAFVSTNNEVFVIKGCAVSQDNLKDIMLAISTVRILQFNTKQAIHAADYTPDDQIRVEPTSQVLYSVSKHLNVRTSYTTNSSKLGFLTYGQPVIVNGIVRMNGRDFGWYRIAFNGFTGYVSSEFLSKIAPQQADSSVQAFTVYAENGAAATIRFISNGHYEDGNGHGYKYLHGSLYYRKDNDTTYSQDPTYWTRYENTEPAFWVYAANGAAVQIYPTADGDYCDAAGNTYIKNPDNTYYCHDMDIDYSTDPDHWANDQSEVYIGINVYGEDGSRATIHWSAKDAVYLDEDGDSYDLVSGNLYSRNSDQLLFSPDPHYWDNSNQDEDAEPYAVGDAFRVYAKDGSSVEIFERSDGQYADYRGHLYVNTVGCIWYCDATNMEYSTDPNEWADEDPDEESSDEPAEEPVYEEPAEEPAYSEPDEEPVENGYQDDAAPEPYEAPYDGDDSDGGMI